MGEEQEAGLSSELLEELKIRLYWSIITVEGHAFAPTSIYLHDKISGVFRVSGSHNIEGDSVYTDFSMIWSIADDRFIDDGGDYVEIIIDLPTKAICTKMRAELSRVNDQIAAAQQVFRELGYPQNMVLLDTSRKVRSWNSDF